LEQIQERYGHDLVIYTDDIVDKLQEISNNGARTIYIHPSQTLPDFPNVNSTVLPEVLGASRIVKTNSEVALMRISAKVSSDAHIMLMKDSQPGLYEYNYSGYFEYYSASCGLQHHSYLPIVGSGNRSAILHYNTNRYQVTNGDIILIDAGSEFRGYGTDITRTFPVNGQFSPAQTLIYEIVENIVNDIESILKPGIRWSDMNTLSRHSVVSALLEAGFLKGDLTELIANEMWYYFYPHGLGHSVGIDVHDPGFRGILQENMIITVEPGIYFNKAFMMLGLNDTIAKNYMVEDKILSYLNNNFGGVRIEDTVLITSTGIENLATVPKSIPEIEEIMNQ
jgi:Xaa-Pro dipeptidase